MKSLYFGTIDVERFCRVSRWHWRSLRSKLRRIYNTGWEPTRPLAFAKQRVFKNYEPIEDITTKQVEPSVPYSIWTTVLQEGSFSVTWQLSMQSMKLQRKRKLFAFSPGDIQRPWARLQRNPLTINKLAFSIRFCKKKNCVLSTNTVWKQRSEGVWHSLLYQQNQAKLYNHATLLIQCKGTHSVIILQLKAVTKKTTETSFFFPSQNCDL